MGFSISWIAVRSDRADAACRRIGLRRTGETAAFFDFPISGTVLPTAWYIAVFNDIAHPLQRAERLPQISAEFPVLRCLVEEHAMYSAAEAWIAGERAWHIVHDPRIGRDHLSTTGDVPAEFAAIERDVTARRQSAPRMAPLVPVDYVFDAPLLMAQRITGFKHDESPPDGRSGNWESLIDGC